ncbi:uncharacterized protein LOC113562132 [Ooceraea biroi]|uniref:uncharacterized protein LOC113562132 n=1 Tax=Ooceraea biroi TaxID=2015173 RepID=UPI000F08361A|nr:uncharacterized protein LOC113562132 [Ooceraea biroi]
MKDRASQSEFLVFIDNIYQSIVIQTKTNKENEEQNVQQIWEKTNEEKAKVWTNEFTLGLIALVEEHQNQFQTLVKKYVWVKISKILQEKFGCSVTWQQCDTKWKGLLKMYKDIKEHNSTSGRFDKGRKRWEYFEVMNNILHNVPEITPVATCSSSKGLIINEELHNSDDSTKDDSLKNLLLAKQTLYQNLLFLENVN